MQADLPPRVPVSSESDWAEETQSLLDGLRRLNIFTVLAHGRVAMACGEMRWVPRPKSAADLVTYFAR